MSNQADTEILKWQHECIARKGRPVMRQIIDKEYCGICGIVHSESIKGTRITDTLLKKIRQRYKEKY